MMKKNNNNDILDLSITSLLFAVELVDDYTNQKPIGPTNIITLNPLDSKPFLNKSGFWVFLKSNNDLLNYEPAKTIKINSTYYFDVIKKITLDNFDDPKNPVITIRLIPKPVYPFSNNITLIRGLITDFNKKPIKDTKITVSNIHIKTTTTEKGEFVLYFAYPHKLISEENFINHNTVDIMLKVLHSNFKEKNFSISIKPSKVVSSTITMENL